MTPATTITVLGPERPHPVLPAVLDGFGIDGPLALISAGWRYDERRDEPLREAVKRPVQNVGLYAAFRDLERNAPDLVDVHARKQAQLKRVKERYRTAIVPAMTACQALFHVHRDPDDPWFRKAVQNLQDIDGLFLAEADRLQRAFTAEARPTEDPRVVAAVARMRDTLDACEVVLVAGGHVGVLRNCLAFFGFADVLRGRRIIAWSGGAMVLTDHVLLFHDHTNWGVGIAEMLDHGLGLIPDRVFLPHARTRLDLDDPENVAILAARLGPRVAIGLENGAVLDGPPGAAIPGACLTLTRTGEVRADGP